MRYMILLIIILLAACQPVQPEGHTGCQEGEIDINGNCQPVTENTLFSQDLDTYVESNEITGDVSGFLAMPKQAASYPGVVMIHEWWGLNNNIKQMAKILAKEGYTVFAIDLYNGEVATDSGKARELATAVRNNPQQAITQMKKAVQYLKNDLKVTHVASLGWCFGGGQSLQLSLNENLDATIIYYGSLIDDQTELSVIDTPVLGIFGEKDSSISKASVNSFESSLNALEITNEIYIYPGVGHAFANPSGSNYAESETLDAWDKTISFLDKHLKN